jgi:hypothetical protein
MPADQTAGRLIHAGRHTKRVRVIRAGEIGISIGSTEYCMPISEANELIGLINAAKHSEATNDGAE